MAMLALVLAPVRAVRPALARLVPAPPAPVRPWPVRLAASSGGPAAAANAERPMLNGRC